MDTIIRGLVIKTTEVGDADKILTILAKDEGKINVSARNARMLKSLATSAFTYADYKISLGKKYYFLKDWDIIESFYSLSRDILCFYCGSYILELTNKTTCFGISANNTLFLAIHILKRMSEQRIDPILAVAVYELKILQYNGFMPVLDRCAICGGERTLIMSPMGTVCKACGGEARLTDTVSERLIEAMEIILAAEPPGLLNIRMDRELCKSLLSVTGRMIYSHFDIRLKTRKYISDPNSFIY